MEPKERAKIESLKIQEQLGKLKAKQKMSDYRLSKYAGMTAQNLPNILSGTVGCSFWAAIALSYALGYELKLVKKSDDEK